MYDIDLIGVPVLVLNVTASGQPVYSNLNRAAIELFGFDPKLTVGRTALEVLPKGIAEVAYVMHTEVVRSGKPLDFRHTASIAGQEHHLRGFLIPRFGPGGEVESIYVTITDETGTQSEDDSVSDRLLAHQETERFVSLAAHDLRTPMRHVSQIADMLREDFEDHGDGKLQLIDMLESISEKATQLIQDVLSHARASEAVPEVGSIDLRVLMDTLLDVLDPLGLHCAEVQSAELTCDRVALTVILRNLVDNAFKHSNGQKVSLQVGLEPGHEGQIAFVVEDDGPGFSRGALDNLNHGTARSGGFGLLGVHKLVTARGGQLQAGNRSEGNGSRVTFSLPGEIVSSDGSDLKLMA